MSTVILYTIRNWSTSDLAKRYFVEQGIPFEERIVNQKAEWWAEVTSISDTVPVIVRDGVVEIGFKGRRGWHIQ